MANNNKKYISLSKLSTFLDNLRSTFASLSHKHTISDITDYVVDTSLSPTSNNPIANSAVDAEFEAISQAMGALDLAIDGKSDATHSHNDIYYTETEIDQKLSGKANTTHNHAISEVTNLQSSLDAKVPTSRTINSKPLSENVSLSASDVGAAPASHNHDDRYYTETEIDSKLSGKSDTTHNHDDKYDTKSAVDNKITAHNTSTTAHSDIRNIIGGLTERLNTLANSDDTTLDQLSEIVAYIKNNKSLIDGITTSKVNVADIINNLTTNVTNKPLSAAQGVAIKALIDDLQEELDTHGHAIADVSGLQSALDGKAASSHGTHVTYSTTAPVMDGTASVGSASTVARSDHKHPTDTSRASKTEFDSHTSNTTVHITSTERTNWNAAKTHADSAHAPSNAEKNQNAFSNIAVSGQTTVAADTATDTVTFVGSNVTITTDATNDKVTFSVSDASTSNKGVVQLTNSTSSTSTTTAATPSSVKSAYDLANQAKTAVTTAQTQIDEVKDNYLPLTGGTVTGTTVFSKVQDAVADSYNSPAVVIGGQPAQAHLELDNNEIQAKSSETKAGNLFLNSNGGTVHVGFDGLKIDSEADIIPEFAVSGNVGTAELPFNKMYGRYHYIYGGENAEYGNLRVGTTGTTSTAGVTTLQLGNAIATGTAHNASGKITMYGSGTAFTNIMPSDRTSGSNAVKLPSTSGTLATVESSTKVAAMTTSEYNALASEQVDANTLYALTDSEDEVIPQIQIITWGVDD